ncbi:MAG: DUF4832 domain-containing protein [Ignavibacteria bacterium]
MLTRISISKNIILIIFLLITGARSLPQTTIIYEGTDELFINPERGFSAYRSNPVTQSFINILKNEYVSVIQRIYTIPQYNDIPLPESFLTTLQNDLNEARIGGVKLVLRFSYTNNQNGDDAALDTILLHINQLTPVLEENYDVIAYIEAGFIGAWGEWYYSSHSLNNTNSRRTVLFSLLDALPEKRSVVIRTPDYKRRIFEDSVPLTIEEAFSGSNKSRTGAHNDCFLASATDYGTYLDNNVEGDKTYLNTDNRFVPQGGETCCDCGYAGCEDALEDLARMHWSVLNKDYHEDVLNRWVSEGCMEEIKRRLGYRFELIEAEVSDSIKPSGIFNIDMKIANKGFASPFNPRNLEMILRNNNDKRKFRLLTNEDPRLWLSGDTANVAITGGMPADMPEGEYDLFLFLSDPEPRLHDNPSYAIRLANDELWEDSTGYNSLNHSVVISNNAGGENYSGDNFFELYNNVTGIELVQQVVPTSYSIDAYPNPFNGSITIKFNINSKEIVEMKIFDVMGRLITTFNNLDFRNNKVIWNAHNQSSYDLSSGIYFFTIRTKDNLFSKKLIYLK